METEKKTYYFELVDVVKFLLKWIKPLSVISVLSAVVAIVASMPYFMKPKFRSTAVFYPSMNNSVSSALLSDTKIKSQDPLEFGGQAVAQQYVQILESDFLRNRVISHFNLQEHYNIKPDDAEKNTKLARKYHSNISIKKTPFASIEVNVLDEDPNMAADIANGIVSILDTIKREVQRRMAQQGLLIIEQQYKNKEHEVNDIKGRMRELGMKGVYSYEDQTKALSEISAKGGNSEQIRKQQENLAQYGSEALSLQETLVLELDKLSELKKKLDQAHVDVDANLSNVHVISSAIPAEKKATPVRWLIVVVSTFGSFVFGCVVLLFIEKLRGIKIQ